jgi:hypothetical protein
LILGSKPASIRRYSSDLLMPMNATAALIVNAPSPHVPGVETVGYWSVRGLATLVVPFAGVLAPVATANSSTD